jgi:hypothetical protein
MNIKKEESSEDYSISSEVEVKGEVKRTSRQSSSSEIQGPHRRAYPQRSA